MGRRFNSTYELKIVLTVLINFLYTLIWIWLKRLKMYCNQMSGIVADGLRALSHFPAHLLYCACCILRYAENIYIILCWIHWKDIITALYGQHTVLGTLVNC